MAHRRVSDRKIGPEIPDCGGLHYDAEEVERYRLSPEQGLASPSAKEHAAKEAKRKHGEARLARAGLGASNAKMERRKREGRERQAKEEIRARRGY